MATSKPISIQSRTHSAAFGACVCRDLGSASISSFGPRAEKQSGLFLPPAVTRSAGGDTCLVQMFQPRREDVSSSQGVVGSFSRPSFSARKSGEWRQLPNTYFFFFPFFFFSLFFFVFLFFCSSVWRQIKINFKRAPCPSANLPLSAWWILSLLAVSASTQYSAGEILVCQPVQSFCSGLDLTRAALCLPLPDFKSKCYSQF